MKSLRARAVVYGLVIVLGLLSALPNVLPHDLSGKLPDWYLNNTVSLGLDLQGGSHLLLQADIEELFASERQAMAEDLSSALRETSIRYGRVHMTGDRVEVPVRAPGRMTEALGIAHELARETPDGSSRFTVDQNGNRLVLTLTESWREMIARDAVERSLEVVRRRLDETGLVDPSITRQE